MMSCAGLKSLNNFPRLALLYNFGFFLSTVNTCLNNTCIIVAVNSLVARGFVVGCRVLTNLLLYFLLRVTAKVDKMKMFGTAAVDDGKMPLMISSQDEKSGIDEGLLILNAQI